MFQRFEPLLSLVRKDELTANDLNKCREYIAALIAFRDTKEPLTVKRFECKKLKLENRCVASQYSCCDFLSDLCLIIWLAEFDCMTCRKEKKMCRFAVFVSRSLI